MAPVWILRSRRLKRPKATHRRRSNGEDSWLQFTQTPRLRTRSILRSPDRRIALKVQVAVVGVAQAQSGNTAIQQHALIGVAQPHAPLDISQDPVNAMLSLAYSMLAKDCTLAALAVGFDPYLGFYHQPRFGRPALGLDLMEEFRPLIAESTVLSCINNRVVTEKDFVRVGQAVNLTAPGRKRFFQTYEQRMSSLITHPLFDYKVSYRRALELQARLLAKTLTGEIPEYIPLMTR